MSVSRSYLTFQLLDSASTSQVADRIRDVTVRRIGPLIEFAYLDYFNAKTQLSSLSCCGQMEGLRSALSKPNLSEFQVETTLSPKGSEFIRGYQNEAEIEDLRWMTFCKRLENAATSAGLADSFAKALTGTVEEMTSNIVEHSERVKTGIVGYRWSGSEFEYVVADSGIGVLSSLRKHTYYSSLTNSGVALETAVQEGESRYGHNVGRGLGFRDLLKNIVNRNSFLRFHSGDYALMIDGTQAPINWRIVRCRRFDGLVISIVAKKNTS